MNNDLKTNRLMMLNIMYSKDNVINYVNRKGSGRRHEYQRLSSLVY